MNVQKIAIVEKSKIRIEHLLAENAELGFW